ATALATATPAVKSGIAPPRKFVTFAPNFRPSLKGRVGLDNRLCLLQPLQKTSRETPLLKRVLIAKRGEIAVRIARAAAALGIESVAIYAPADALSLHTRIASDARALASSPDPVSAYLDIEAIIAVARETKCDCVHPGYGFLAENADFATR